MSHYIDLPGMGLECPLTEEETAVQDTMRRFAREVMRPVADKIDRLPAEEAYAEGSPFWDVKEKYNAMGMNIMDLMVMEPKDRIRMSSIISEELCQGDPGMAAVILTEAWPTVFSLLAGNEKMVEFTNGKRGCWAITEPDHGSDMLDASGSCQVPNGNYGRPNCIAKIEGDKVVINGQKSAWVSVSMTAEVCGLFCHADLGEGKTGPGIAVIVPMDAEGVSRGKPLDKMGLRALNQGEIFFDNVEVPIDNLLVGPDQYQELAYKMLTEANPHVGLLYLGVGRCAYKHALQYAHERIAGGQKIIHHPTVRYRLFHMFRKLEAARALTRRAMEFNALAPEVSLMGSCAAKITATQTAFEVCNEAIQIFGGNGVTKEYPMEKLLRDARTGLIADGCNEFLALKGSSQLVNPDLL